MTTGTVSAGGVVDARPKLGVVPPDIIFTSLSEAVPETSVTIKNEGTSPTMFKLLNTVKGKYKVNPPQGFLVPGDSATVRISLRSKDGIGIPGAPNDKFRLMGVHSDTNSPDVLQAPNKQSCFFKNMEVIFCGNTTTVSPSQRVDTPMITSTMFKSCGMPMESSVIDNKVERPAVNPPMEGEKTPIIEAKIEQTNQTQTPPPEVLPDQPVQVPPEKDKQVEKELSVVSPQEEPQAQMQTQISPVNAPDSTTSPSSAHTSVPPPEIVTPTTTSATVVELINPPTPEEQTQKSAATSQPPANNTEKDIGTLEEVHTQTENLLVNSLNERIKNLESTLEQKLSLLAQKEKEIAALSRTRSELKACVWISIQHTSDDFIASLSDPC
ncbi:hypothetical protein Pelo_17593 [Pelomyxa schiedti]|nr:hypothetical protein Pelo_17593 [Pelomyxa schiedti]